MEMRHRLVEAAGHHARIVETGAGPPLLLLASPLILARSYRWTIQRLGAHFRVLTVELPGCGGASKLAAPWNVQQYADWLALLLDQIGLERSILIGHSSSGPIVAILAAQHPQRVFRLVLAGTVGGDPTRPLARVILDRMMEAPLELLLSLSSFHHPIYNLLFHTRNFISQMQLAATTDLRPWAPRVRTPTLLAWGGRDHTMPLRTAKALDELLPDSRLYVAPTGSHDWLIDHADEFTAAVLDFVHE